MFDTVPEVMRETASETSTESKRGLLPYITDRELRLPLTR